MGFQKNLNQKGAIHLLLLAAVIGVLSFLAISSAAPFKDKFLASVFPKNASFAASGVVNINGNSNVHPISKYIYGVSAGNDSYLRTMGATIVRWGGNQSTRSNWENNSSNSGFDWGLCDGRWSNVNQANGGSTVPGKASLDFVNGNKAIGADSLISIPMLGWVAKDGNNSNCSTGVPSQGGFPVSAGSEAISGYDPTTNRNKTSIPSQPKKGSAFSYPPNASDNVVYQDEWVNYLKNQFGNANSGGVKFYSMDNEYDLWYSTHTDIHPVYPTYDELWTKFKDTAEGVKAVDSLVSVTGPVGWGPMSLLNSPNGWNGGNDRTSHGNLPIYQWFLRQAKTYETQNGKRLLDVLSVHYYPQNPGNGVGQIQFPGATDATTNAYRLRSIRSLWDPNYNEESWMGSLETGAHLRYIPRLKEMITQEYPGTKTALTEFNWGAENNINGGLAVAELLGVFGRENLDLATYWTTPPNNSPAYFAYRMYRNVDGNFTGFGDTSIGVTADPVDVDKFSVYGSKDSVTNETKIMLINKDPQNQQTVTLSLANIVGGGAAKVYQYSKNDTSKIVQLPNLTNLASTIQYPMPSYSITLLIFDPNVVPSGGTVIISPQPTPTPPPLNSTPTYIYNDALSSGWQNWSYNNASVNLASTVQKRSGTNSIAWTGNAWAGLYLHSDTGINTTGYNTLHFALFGTNNTNSYKLSLHDTSSGELGSVNLEDYGVPTAGGWKVYDIPLSAFGINDGTVVGEFQLFSNSGSNQQVVYVDEIRFMGIAPSAAPTSSPAASVPSPSPSPAKPGDTDGDNDVDIFDYNIILTDFGKTGTGLAGDIDKSGKVDIFDYNLLLTNFGK